MYEIRKIVLNYKENFFTIKTSHFLWELNWNYFSMKMFAFKEKVRYCQNYTLEKIKHWLALSNKTSIKHFLLANNHLPSKKDENIFEIHCVLKHSNTDTVGIWLFRGFSLCVDSVLEKARREKSFIRTPHNSAHKPRYSLPKSQRRFNSEIL